MSVRISGAALVQYIESVKGISLAEYRAELSQIVKAQKPRKTFTRDGFRYSLFVSRGDTTVTAVYADARVGEGKTAIEGSAD
jgi:hypothetical protein